ncbi:MAG: VIT domain-containing protein [Phycisphaerales bacterium JB050]
MKPTSNEHTSDRGKRRRNIILTSVLVSAVAVAGFIAACSTQSATVQRQPAYGLSDGQLRDELAKGWTPPNAPSDSSVTLHYIDPSLGAEIGSVPDPTSGLSIDHSLPSLREGLRRYDYSSGSEGEGQTATPSFVDAPGEELWIISRTPRDPQVAQTRPRTLSPDDPGSGCLVAIVPGQTQHVPVPLEHTEVGADIRGYIGAVGVQQRFHNPFDTKIEAVYVFPLPQNSAINEFLMTVGDRTIRGIIREKEEAEQIYNQARAQGHVASLMTQQRPNIFTQKVANIEPGKTIDIDITYFQTLRYDNDAWEFTFPMVVGPRFNPAGSTDGIGAAPVGAQPGATGQTTQISYLAPEQRSGHDIGLTVNIDAGMPVGRISSRSHVIEVDRHDSTRATVRLASTDTIPNKDFVLRYEVASSDIRSGLITHDNGDGTGYFSLMLVPPADATTLERKPVELVFVLDCSGSMRGKPMEQSKAAMRRALRSMQPEDTFQIVRFSSNASQLGTRPLEATNKNIERGLEYIDGLSGGGGTMMIEGIKAALDFPQDPKRLRYVVFLTDGYIGNESEILGAVHDKLGNARVFSFGVGSSPNRFLMERMAKIGNGCVAFLGLNDPAVDVMDDFFERVSHPAMTDLAIDFGNAEVESVYPRRPADLYAGRPVIITGRYNGSLPDTIAVRGRLGGETRDLLVPVRDAAASGERFDALAALWARTKIADLAEQMTWTRDQDTQFGLAGEIERVALAHNLMSAYTAFVAVDSLTITEGSHGVTVPVAVPVPDGVLYETTVPGRPSTN